MYEPPILPKGVPPTPKDATGEAFMRVLLFWLSVVGVMVLLSIVEWAT